MTHAALGFLKLGIHNLVYADDFCPFAPAIRKELLEYPHWIEMRQGGTQGSDTYAPYNQNGITTGHLGNSKRNALSYCLSFSDFLFDHRNDICGLVDVTSVEGMQIEMNAMAYGEGSWLSPHTDHNSSESDQRLVAWMLYLTDPSDGEWPEDKGGALRVSVSGDMSVRLRPKFNRFAAFKVSENSVHEIETITWNCEWEKCRLALSGWLRGPTSTRPFTGTGVYLRSADYLKIREQVETTLKGSLALYSLMYQQRKYCGVDAEAIRDKLAQVRKDYQSHAASPPGTSFVRVAAGPEGCIVVLNEDKTIAYFGPRDGYPQQ